MKIEIKTLSGPETLRVTWLHDTHDPDGCRCGANFTHVTVAFLALQDEAGIYTDLSSGEAHCHRLDSFDKDKGRKLSLARALKTARIDRDTRVQVWDAYFNR